MTRFALAISLVLSLAVPGLASAETIAVVNIQKIMQNSVAAQSARDQLKVRQTMFQNEIKQQEQELKKEDQDLAKQQSLLAPDAFQDKVKAFRNKASAVQKDAVTKRGQLSKALDETLVELQKSIVQIIAEMSKEKGFSVAIPTSQTLYAEPQLDITEEVLARLNKRKTSLKVNF